MNYNSHSLNDLFSEIENHYNDIITKENYIEAITQAFIKYRRIFSEPVKTKSKDYYISKNINNKPRISVNIGNYTKNNIFPIAKAIDRGGNFYQGGTIRQFLIDYKLADKKEIDYIFNSIKSDDDRICRSAAIRLIRILENNKDELKRLSNVLMKDINYEFSTINTTLHELAHNKFSESHDTKLVNIKKGLILGINEGHSFATAKCVHAFEKDWDGNLEKIIDEVLKLNYGTWTLYKEDGVPISFMKSMICLWSIFYLTNAINLFNEQDPKIKFDNSHYSLLISKLFLDAKNRINNIKTHDNNKFQLNRLYQESIRYLKLAENQLINKIEEEKKNNFNIISRHIDSADKNYKLPPPPPPPKKSKLKEFKNKEFKKEKVKSGNNFLGFGTIINTIESISIDLSVLYTLAQVNVNDTQSKNNLENYVESVSNHIKEQINKLIKEYEFDTKRIKDEFIENYNQIIQSTNILEKNILNKFKINLN